MIPPIRGLDGNLLEYGTAKHTLEWDAATGSPPSWLTVRPGLALQGLNPGPPALVGGFSSDTSKALWFPEIGVVNASAFKLTLRGFYGVGVQVQPRFWPVVASPAPNREGVYAVIQPGSGVTTFFRKRDNTDHPTIYSPYQGSSNGGRAGKFDISLLWNRRTQYAYLMEGDQVVGAVDLTADFIEPTSVQPTLNFYGSTAAHTVEIGGVSLEVWYG